MFEDYLTRLGLCRPFPSLPRFQLVVSSIIYDGTAVYEYEVKLFDLTYSISSGASTREIFVPPDPAALVAAAVAVSRDNQELYVYYPESTVRHNAPVGIATTPYWAVSTSGTHCKVTTSLRRRFVTS